jgi:hypothetical protein
MAKKQKRQQMPEQIYIYVADRIGVDGETIYGVALTLEEIPEDAPAVVGVYERVREAKLIITRDLA